MCASQWVLNKARRRNESTGRRGVAAFGIRSLGAGRTETRAFHLWEKMAELSAHVGTRKMVNYAGQDEERETWWRSVKGFLTCKKDRQIWV
ncbi:hypothetical protein JTE90_008229 [Oedothorax gibbosus]|uniref:Uncharacterized protein n=1 Tax=Oedothorax gibbosus TaxID=931172 RepID=A0AAV6TGP4_9ARAC|nr:hypothetical protein JTE90_008229 [Oedothorax gibbosus]